jgi:fermentation-respiration switch protein FrsA (DUF1100 family)
MDETGSGCRLLGTAPAYAQRAIACCVFLLAGLSPQIDCKGEEPVLSIEEMFLFFPSKEGDWTPAQLKFEDVYFAATDGTNLHGWYCPGENPRAAILIAHGNGGNIAVRAPWLQVLQKTLRVSVFIFDYRGYGRSEGTPSVMGILQDAQAARQKLCELASVKDTDVVLMGESLGGAVAVQLAVQSPPRALVLQSTFSSLRDIVAVHSRFAFVVPKGKLNSVEAISQYHGPLLQSHGDQDRTVPVELGKKLFDAANDPKQWYAVQGARS